MVSNAITIKAGNYNRVYHLSRTKSQSHRCRRSNRLCGKAFTPKTLHYSTLHLPFICHSAAIHLPFILLLYAIHITIFHGFQPSRGARHQYTCFGSEAKINPRQYGVVRFTQLFVRYPVALLRPKGWEPW